MDTAHKARYVDAEGGICNNATGGAGGPDATNGLPGSALGNSIFLRSHSTLTFTAADADDLLTLGNQVAFIDDTSFGGGATLVHVTGNGNVVYNGTTDYQGSVRIDNANFKVNGEIDEANISVCRNSSFSSQKGTLSGTGILTGDISVNSGIISPDTGGTLTLGSLTLSSGSSVHIDINATSTSLVDISRTAGLAGTLEIDLETSAQPGVYTILTSTGLTGTFDSVTFTGQTPNYTLSYLPTGAPTFVQFNFLGYPSSAVDIPATLNGSPVLNASVVCCDRPVILAPLPISGRVPLLIASAVKQAIFNVRLGKQNHKLI